jgi:hypothetical protein
MARSIFILHAFFNDLKESAQSAKVLKTNIFITFHSRRDEKAKQ